MRVAQAHKSTYFHDNDDISNYQPLDYVLLAK